MPPKSEQDRAKQIQDKCQTVLNEMLRDEDNKYCVDCDTKGPRWASWNLGVFLCIRCAGIHRNLGVHISKVKSVNLDTWTPEQVVSLQQMGNSRARAVYEANLPDNFRRPQSDSSLESFVRAKYEHKKYIAREWVPPSIPKVNWEKEIDEELERQKRKKKQFTDNKTKSPSSVAKQNVEIPQLPKPRSVMSSGASTTNSTGSNTSSKATPPRVDPPAAAGHTAPVNKSNFDLLRLDSNSQSTNNATPPSDDTFSSFLSATPNNPKSEDKQEEENFFNQPAPTEKEKTQLTKDSILALYGNKPQQPTNTMFQTFPNQFQAAGTGGAAFPPQQNANAFQPGYQAAGFTYNGFQQFSQPPTFGASANFATPAQPNFTTQQVTAPAGVVPNAFNPTLGGNQLFAGLPQKGVFPQTNAFQQFLPQNQMFGATQQIAPPFGGPTQNVVPNPFLNQAPPVNLQQQFGNLTMNNVQQPPVSANVWQ